ncbi:MAG: prepilin-type N-terminal cleavage/methylation domain-containing protein [Gammaproteobacteria bacterium]|nr:prepilin-type N-terminal cleavage/methylation domain-containing protein [Gammaproteobacteria bacterium]NND60013.1 prepilin-type N-terminal cleavage/methylation domain-containing protein [Gammaproteobacteria bacterium]
MNGSPKQLGFTLVENVVAIVVIAIAAGVILGLLATNVGASADPMIRQQAVAIASAYTEEILLRSFDDPDGVDGEGARADFDDIDDYDGLLDNGARDQFGNAISGLESYDIAVSVVTSSALPGVAAGDTVRVDVTVSRAPQIAMTVSSYRTRR